MTDKIPFEETISYLIAQVAKSHRNKAGQLLSEVELHPGQEMVLKQLSGRCVGATHSELAHDLDVRPATVSRMIDRMEQAGLVQRCKDMQDQRVSRVHLTEQGQQCEAPVDDAWHQLEEITIANFTVEERLILRRLLLQLYTNLKD